MFMPNKKHCQSQKVTRNGRQIMPEEEADVDDDPDSGCRTKLI